MTLLEDLWYGNIDPHERILTDSKRYKHLLPLMARNRDELNETLTDRQSQTLEKYDSAVNEMHSLAEVEALSYGFRLGIRIMIDVVSLNDEPAGHMNPASNRVENSYIMFIYL